VRDGGAEGVGTLGVLKKFDPPGGSNTGLET
jgi:hypothetical protein